MVKDEKSVLHDIEVLIEQLSIKNTYPTWRLNNRRETADAWELLWHDLKTKTKALASPEKRSRYLIEGLLQRLVADGVVEARDLRTHIKRFVEQSKPAYDAIIFTIRPEEFLATCLAFGTKPTGFVQAGEEFQYAHADAELSTRADDDRSPVPVSEEKVRVRIVQCDRQRNVPMAICCRTILEAHNTRQCILIGIAAGNHHAGVKLGDVVVGLSILDFEGGIVPPRGWAFSTLLRRIFPAIVSRRPITVNVTQGTRAKLQLFLPEKYSWLDDYPSELAKLDVNHAPVPTGARDRLPGYRTATICSGEKVRRDGVIADLAQTDNQICALEMEASGFAAACRSKNVDWVVCRGISDFGDARKNDKWHHVAPLNAALAMRAYLRFLHQYRPPADRLKG